MEFQKPSGPDSAPEAEPVIETAKPLLPPPPTPQRKILEPPVELNFLDILKP